MTPHSSATSPDDDSDAGGTPASDAEEVRSAEGPLKDEAGAPSFGPSPAPVPRSKEKAAAPAKPQLTVLGPRLSPTKSSDRSTVPPLAELDGFSTEEFKPDKTGTPSGRQPLAFLRASRPGVVVIVVLAAISGVEFFLLARVYSRRASMFGPGASGTVIVESTPPGATIAIDGHDRGKTPSTLMLLSGHYALTIGDGILARQVPLTVEGGNSTHILIDAPDAPRAAAEAGTLAPEHSAVPPATELEAGASTLPANALGGWVSVDAPIDVQLFEGAALIGSNQTRVMLPAGRHVLSEVNTALGYKNTSIVQVVAGSVARIRLEMPPASMNINAVPWADVFVDGKHVGPTPLGDVSLSIGPHEVVFVHPQLGERRETVTVTLNGANRVSVNFNQRN